MIQETKIKEQFEEFTPYELRCETGWIVGTYQHKDNRICVSHVNSDKKGTMKKLIEYLVTKFKTNNILFYNILNTNIADRVKGFETFIMEDPHFHEPVICLRGMWK